MEGSLTELSKYRFETARSDLKVAKMLYKAKEFRSSVNRSHYSIFHALRSVLALDGFNSRTGHHISFPRMRSTSVFAGFAFTSFSPVVIIWSTDQHLWQHLAECAEPHYNAI